jgi:hypothetical protein
MNGSVVVAWILTAVFLVLTLPCVMRLVRLDYVSLGQAARVGDVAELLLVLAMVAMLSPIGGPIPAAGWEAMFLLASSWFLSAWWRGRRAPGRGSAHGQCAHHALSAFAMLYMIAAMPTGGPAHGPWLTMSTMDAQGGLAWPAVAVLAAAYFVIDAARSGILAMRASPDAFPAPGFASRAVCRSIMGLGMGYLLIAAL